MYCGDDVSSIVLDIGSFNLWAGYSGEDMPRIVIPSHVGYISSKSDPSHDVNKLDKSKDNIKRITG